MLYLGKARDLFYGFTAMMGFEQHLLGYLLKSSTLKVYGNAHQIMSHHLYEMERLHLMTSL